MTLYAYALPHHAASRWLAAAGPRHLGTATCVSTSVTKAKLTS